MLIATCGPVPVQPGLCFQQISPAPNGKTHIFDSYVTWQSYAQAGFHAGRRLCDPEAVGEYQRPASRPRRPTCGAELPTPSIN